MSRAGDFADRFKVKDRKQFRLQDVNPRDTGGLKSKVEAEALLQAGITLLREQSFRIASPAVPDEPGPPEPPRSTND